MKKSIIGAIVGGIIILVWQTLSFTVLKVHRSAEKYTPKQDSIVSYLSSHLKASGNYILPNSPDNASMDEYNNMMKDMQGKPWAVVLYHKTYNENMMKNMAYGLLVNILIVWMLCWILLKINAPSFGTVFIASLFAGLIVFLNAPITYHIWYLSFGTKGDLIDAIASFGLTGLWLGWWLPKK